jgi:hypothetical protein
MNTTQHFAFFAPLRLCAFAVSLIRYGRTLLKLIPRGYFHQLWPLPLSELAARWRYW